MGKCNSIMGLLLDLHIGYPALILGIINDSQSLPGEILEQCQTANFGLKTEV